MPQVRDAGGDNAGSVLEKSGPSYDGRPSARRGIACAGNWIVDIVHTITHWPNQGDLVRISRQAIGLGGGAANVLTDLHTLGADFPLAAIGCIGDDAYGGMVREHCRRLNVARDDLLTLVGTATAQSHVMTVPGKSRTFFYHGGANDALTADAVPIDELAADGFRLFYLGYLLALDALDRLDTAGTTGASVLLERAQRAGLITCADAVSDTRSDFDRIVAPALPHCDYLIVNEIEASRATGVAVRAADAGALERNSVEAAAARLLERGVGRAVIIHAPEAAVWAAPGSEPEWADAERLDPDQIVSPVGAGDAFCACLLYGIHEGWPVPTMLRIAHLGAAASLAGATATDGLPAMTDLAESARFDIR